MSRFRFDATAPTVVASLTEAGAVWARMQPKIDLHRMEPLLPLSAEHLASHVQACQQDIRASGELAGTPRTLWVLGSFWINTWVQPRPSGVASMSELEKLAKARAAQLFGPSPDGQSWRVSADWKSRTAFLCHAAPATVLDKIGTEAIETPLTLALLAATRLPELQARERTIWMAFTAPGETHVIAFEQGYPVGLTSRRGPPETDTGEALNQAISMWRLEQTRTGQRSDRLYWLNGALQKPTQLGQALQAISPIKAPWQHFQKDEHALPPAQRWLTWILGMQRAFS